MSVSELCRSDLFHKDSDAVFSACGKYRYWLHRRWRIGRGWAVFVMLNPSTAGAVADDATIRTCIGFAKRWECEGMIAVNLFAWRATDPADLLDAQKKDCDIIGVENHAYVTKAMEMADEHFPDAPPKRRYPGRLICAWGANKIAPPQVPTMLGWLDHSVIGAKCLGIVGNGMPRHPLYTPFSTVLKPYDFRRSV